MDQYPGLISALCTMRSTRAERSATIPPLDCSSRTGAVRYQDFPSLALFPPILRRSTPCRPCRSSRTGSRRATRPPSKTRSSRRTALTTLHHTGIPTSLFTTTSRCASQARVELSASRLTPCASQSGLPLPDASADLPVETQTLTVRAIVVGCALGSVVQASNLCAPPSVPPSAPIRSANPSIYYFRLGPQDGIHGKKLPAPPPAPTHADLALLMHSSDRSCRPRLAPTTGRYAYDFVFRFGAIFGFAILKSLSKILPTWFGGGYVRSPVRLMSQSLPSNLILFSVWREGECHRADCRNRRWRVGYPLRFRNSGHGASLCDT